MRRARSMVVAAVLMLGACDGGGDGADAAQNNPDADTPTGTLSLTWTLADGAGAVTCDQVKATQVVVDLLPNAGGPGFTDIYPCGPGTGMGTPHPTGSYDVDVKLKNSSGQTMASVTRIQDIDVLAGQDTALGAQAFTVSRNGGFTFKLDVGSTDANNCGTEGGTPPGANITGLTLELRNSGGTCVAAAFDVAAGGQGAQTLAAVCPPPSATCIENDQQITVMDVPAGDYTIAITGVEGAEVCYTGVSSFSVSGGDVIKQLSTLQIALDLNNANCVSP